jgi:hypothetical protein
LRRLQWHYKIYNVENSPTMCGFSEDNIVAAQLTTNYRGPFETFPMMVKLALSEGLERSKNSLVVHGLHNRLQTFIDNLP